MKVLKWRGKELGVLVLSAGILQSGLAILRERCFLTGWKSLMFMGFFCMGVRFLAVALVRRPMIGKTRYQVRLFLNEKSKEFTAMADSGNRLLEPVTGKPVSIIAAADAKEFLGEKAGRGLETSGRRDRRGTLQYWKRLSGTYGKMSCRRTAGIRWDMGSLETAGDRIFDDLDRFSGKTDHAPGEKECFCR